MSRIRLYSIFLLLFAIVAFMLHNNAANMAQKFVATELMQNAPIPSLDLVKLTALGLMVLNVSFFILLMFYHKPAPAAADNSKPDIHYEQIRVNTEAQRESEKLKTDTIANELELALNEMSAIPDSELLQHFLPILSKYLHVVQGLYFARGSNDVFTVAARYAFYSVNAVSDVAIGEGISGQVLLDQQILYVNNVPDNYVTVLSGLGSSSPRFLCLIPIVQQGKSIGLIELATFSEIGAYLPRFLPEVAEHLGRRLT